MLKSPHFLAIDVGGTKTLFAVFDHKGKILEEIKIKTPQDYGGFLEAVTEVADKKLSKYEIEKCCCALPGRIDHKANVVVGFGNLPWHAVPVKKNLQKILVCPVIIENDAKLAGLSEAHLVKDKYRRVYYLTVSTGIGGGFIVDGLIDQDVIDSEPGQMMLEFEGDLKLWEHFASGHAIVQRFGKKAVDINDKHTWHIIAKDLAVGVYEIIATFQPDAIIIGGGVGTHFNKYGKILQHEVSKFESPIVPIPPILPARHAEEAVIYGCYELIKQQTL